MTKTAIREEVLKVLKDSPYLNGEVKDGMDMRADLGFDSLDFVEIVMEVEEGLRIELADEAVEDIKTVGEFIGLVTKVKGVTDE